MLPAPLDTKQIQVMAPEIYSGDRMDRISEMPMAEKRRICTFSLSVLNGQQGRPTVLQQPGGQIHPARQTKGDVCPVWSGLSIVQSH
jgi:hypothetical protein